MDNERTCVATYARKDLIVQLRKLITPSVTEPVQGTEKELLDLYSELTGVFAEYTNGGDEMAEMCTCKKHIENDGRTFEEMVEANKTW